MPRYRFKSESYDTAVYDGELVGMFDPVFGKVVTGTCPAWFPAVMQEVDTLAMLEVKDGEFIEVANEGMFFGKAGAWVKVEPASRIIHGDDGQVDVVTAAEFVNLFEPA